MKLAASVLAAVFAVGGAAADVTFGTITSATFEAPTTRYAHGVLGDEVEYGALRIARDCRNCQGGLSDLVITLPETRVFEDVAPRLVDLDGAAGPEVIVVESDQQLGARLAVYDLGGLVTATPFIGRRNRWLAPVGAADLDGDGHVEIAYVDRPHLAKTLRVWRYRDGVLEPLADLPGVTNHRIGERDIAGGIRTCAGRPEMVVASADWARVLGIRFDGAGFATRDIGPHEGRVSFAQALEC